MDIAAKDPIEAILSEADKQRYERVDGRGYVCLVRFYSPNLWSGINVWPKNFGTCMDITNLLCFYVSEESGGGLDNWEQLPEIRKRER